MDRKVLIWYLGFYVVRLDKSLKLLETAYIDVEIQSFGLQDGKT